MHNNLCLALALTIALSIQIQSFDLTLFKDKKAQEIVHKGSKVKVKGQRKASKHHLSGIELRSFDSIQPIECMETLQRLCHIRPIAHMP